MLGLLDLLYFSYYPFPIVIVGVWIIIFHRAFHRWGSPLSKLPYPLGPPERGIIAGNAADIPGTKSWLTYVELGKKYGNVIHLRAYSEHTIVVNSYEDCVELFEKRSNIYSDCPNFTMVNMMGWDFNAAFMRYGAEWRAHMHLYNQVFRPKASLNYRPIQARKVHDLLYGLLDTPQDFMNHYRTLPEAIIMSAMYDYDVASKDDFFVDLAKEVVRRLGHAVLPGAALVNVFPILRFIPSWFPGAGFKRFALATRNLVLQTRDLPFASVELKMKEGKTPNCIVAELLENCSSKEEHTRIAGVAGTSYGDTSTSSLGTFFCAMVMFPEVQAKAKREIDLIVGSERMINFDDRPSLPYLEALRREVMRWRPVSPLGLSRAASSDDVYKGWYIPKNHEPPLSKAIAHDPARYSDPDSFNPDRFFSEDGDLNNDEINFAFGFGRRLCPGRHMASATIWLVMATVLQNFDIKKKHDSMNKEILVSGKYSDGFISYPLPFECSITPRSEEAIKIILDSVKRT